MLRRPPGDAPGGLGEVSGTSREPPGMARGRPRAIFLSAEATSEALWEETFKMSHVFGGVGAVCASLFD